MDHLYTSVQVAKRGQKTSAALTKDVQNRKLSGSTTFYKGTLKISNNRIQPVWAYDGPLKKRKTKITIRKFNVKKKRKFNVIKYLKLLIVIRASS